MALSKEISKTFNYESFVHAISGATGSVVAMSAFYPLDTIRQRSQVESPSKEPKGLFQYLMEVINTEGISSLYRGLIPVLQSVCVSNLVYFYTFHSIRAFKGVKQSNSALTDLLFASIAGAINVMLTTPLWVVNTRLKMKGMNIENKTYNCNYDNLFEGLVYVGKTEGINGLWAGAIPSLLLVSNPALQFMFYEAVKRRLQKITPKLNSFTVFFIGALSKAFATIITYPLQLIQTKLRTESKENRKKQAGTLATLLSIAKQYGLKGLYQGLEAKIWQTILTAALMFTVYERIALTIAKIFFLNKK